MPYYRPKLSFARPVYTPCIAPWAIKRRTPECKQLLDWAQFRNRFPEYKDATSVETEQREDCAVEPCQIKLPVDPHVLPKVHHDPLSPSHEGILQDLATRREEWFARLAGSASLRRQKASEENEDALQRSGRAASPRLACTPEQQEPDTINNKRPLSKIESEDASQNRMNVDGTMSGPEVDITSLIKVIDLEILSRRKVQEQHAMEQRQRLKEGREQAVRQLKVVERRIARDWKDATERYQTQVEVDGFLQDTKTLREVLKEVEKHNQMEKHLGIMGFLMQRKGLAERVEEWLDTLDMPEEGTAWAI